MNQTKLFLLFFSLNCLLSLQTEIKEDANNYKEIKTGDFVEFDKNNNLFKFNYNGNASIIIISLKKEKALYITDPKGDKKEIKRIDGYYISDLIDNGTYLLEIICETIRGELGAKFETFIPGTSEEIDLNKNDYSRNIVYETNIYYNYTQFRVRNIKEDKYVYFQISSTNSYYQRTYYPYYPSEPAPGSKEDLTNLTIFEVVNLKDPQKSMRNVKIYKFEKNNEYEINIRCLKNYSPSSYQYIYVDYLYL